jgi:diguanylate cyclase (GGDEF)-like protein/PAS domain S-box-containing protein
VESAVGAERGSGPAREDSICTHVVAEGAPVIIEDVARDPRCASIGPDVGAYAGVPLRTADGHVIGSFCVWGPEPRPFGWDAIATLTALANAAMAHIELQRRTAEADAARAELHAVLEHAPDAFVSVDAEGVVLAWNREAERLFGWAEDEALGRAAAGLFVPPELHGVHRENLRRPDVSPRPMEFEALRRDGSRVPVELRLARVGDRLNAFARDISERRALEAQQQRLLSRLEELSRTDPLTGALNRRAMDETRERELARAARSGEPLALAVVDLDHFKAYNDAHGHAAGDELLRGCVAAWRTALRAMDVLARAGGEEFVVVLPRCTAAEAVAISERLNELVPDGRTCSVGVAAWDRSEPAAALLERADGALYAAKAAGRSRVCTG